MHEINLSLSSRDLLDFLNDLRLLAEVEFFEQKAREEEVLKEMNPSFQGSIENVNRFFKRTFFANKKKAEDAKKKEALFREAHPGLLSFRQAEEARNLLFFGDSSGEARLYLALSSFVSNEISPSLPEVGYQAISKFLFGEESILPKRFASFEKHLDALSPNFKKEKAKAFALAFSGALGLVALPGAMVATTASIPFSATLSSLGLAVEATAFATCLVAFLSGSEKYFSLQEEEQAFKELDPDSLSFLLAGELTLIEHLQDTLSKEDFKKALDHMLQKLEDKKGDLDYFAFVEGKSKEEGFQKIRSFHVFDERLMKVLSRC